jgi:hypothetical protein
MYCLRDYEAILVWSEELELERMPDAARPVNGCNVSHVEVQTRCESSRRRTRLSLLTVELTDVFRH